MSPQKSNNDQSLLSSRKQTARRRGNNEQVFVRRLQPNDVKVGIGSAWRTTSDWPGNAAFAKLVEKHATKYVAVDDDDDQTSIVTQIWLAMTQQRGGRFVQAERRRCAANKATTIWWREMAHPEAVQTIAQALQEQAAAAADDDDDGDNDNNTDGDEQPQPKGGAHGSSKTKGGDGDGGFMGTPSRHDVQMDPQGRLHKGDAPGNAAFSKLVEKQAKKYAVVHADTKRSMATQLWLQVQEYGGRFLEPSADDDDDDKDKTPPLWKEVAKEEAVQAIAGALKEASTAAAGNNNKEKKTARGDGVSNNGGRSTKESSSSSSSKRKALIQMPSRDDVKVDQKGRLEKRDWPGNVAFRLLVQKSSNSQYAQVSNDYTISQIWLAIRERGGRFLKRQVDPNTKPILWREMTKQEAVPTIADALKEAAAANNNSEEEGDAKPSAAARPSSAVLTGQVSRPGHSNGERSYSVAAAKHSSSVKSTPRKSPPPVPRRKSPLPSASRRKSPPSAHLNMKRASAAVAAAEPSSSTTAKQAPATPVTKRSSVMAQSRRPTSSKGVIEEPSPHDFLMGRGHGEWPGNQELTKLAQQYAASYEAAKKPDKAAIATKVVHAFQKQGGKLLKVEDRNGQGKPTSWKEIDMESAVIKAAAELREAFKEQSNSSGAEEPHSPFTAKRTVSVAAMPPPAAPLVRQSSSFSIDETNGNQKRASQLLDQQHVPKKRRLRPPERPRCDLCWLPDQDDGKTLLTCRVCGIQVHDLCYAFPASCASSEPFCCWACQAVKKTTTKGRDYKGRLHEVPQPERPTECCLCSVNDKKIPRPMHALYDGPAKYDGLPVVLVDKHDGKTTNKRLAWVHTLCAMTICQHANTRGCVYGCYEDGTPEGDEDSDSDGNDDNDSNDKDQERPVHHFAYCSPRDPDAAQSIRNIREFQRDLKCSFCGSNDKPDSVYKIPIQCCAGDDTEFEEFQQTHPELKKSKTPVCTVALHVGCAMWAKNERGQYADARRVYFYPGSDAAETRFAKPESNVFCDAHAQDIKEAHKKGSDLRYFVPYHDQQQQRQQRQHSTTASSQQKDDKPPIGSLIPRKQQLPPIPRRSGMGVSPKQPLSSLITKCSPSPPHRKRVRGRQISGSRSFPPAPPLHTERQVSGTHEQLQMQPRLSTPPGPSGRSGKHPPIFRTDSSTSQSQAASKRRQSSQVATKGQPSAKRSRLSGAWSTSSESQPEEETLFTEMFQDVKQSLRELKDDSSRSQALKSRSKYWTRKCGLSSDKFKALWQRVEQAVSDELGIPLHHLVSKTGPNVAKSTAASSADQLPSQQAVVAVHHKKYLKDLHHTHCDFCREMIDDVVSTVNAMRKKNPSVSATSEEVLGPLRQRWKKKSLDHSRWAIRANDFKDMWNERVKQAVVEECEDNVLAPAKAKESHPVDDRTSRQNGRAATSATNGKEKTGKQNGHQSASAISGTVQSGSELLKAADGVPMHKNDKPAQQPKQQSAPKARGRSRKSDSGISESKLADFDGSQTESWYHEIVNGILMEARERGVSAGSLLQDHREEWRRKLTIPSFSFRSLWRRVEETIATKQSSKPTGTDWSCLVAGENYKPDYDLFSGPAKDGWDSYEEL